MKGLISLAAIISIVIGFLILTTSIGPIIINTINNAPESDANSINLMRLIVPMIFLMLIITAFLYAFDRKPPGHWSGE